MVSPTFASPSSSPGPAPLAWKEFRRRSGLNSLPKVYVYDASPQIVPHSPIPSALTLSPLLAAAAAPLGQDSPRKDHSGYLVSHVTQALQSLGASTGGNIADYIANNFHTEQGVPYEKGRKLHYMVNAILSSPKYKYIFLKDQVLKDEKRSLWRLKQPGDTEEDSSSSSSHAASSSSASAPLQISLASLIPPSASLSSLIPASPSLSLDTLSHEHPATPVVSAPDERECGGGSDENRDERKHIATEHPIQPLSPLSSPSSPSTSPPFSMSPSSPQQSDTPATSLSSRRKKRKGSAADLSSSSSSIEIAMPPSKLPAEEQEKKRRLDISAA